MEGPLVHRAGQEGLAPEDQCEQLEGVPALTRVECEQIVVVTG